MKQVSTSKWEDKEWRREYGKKWREQQKLKAAKAGPQQPLTTWKQRQLKRQANEVRPLNLPGCPECGGEFFIKKNGKYEPMRLSSCNLCGRRFYQAGGQV